MRKKRIRLINFYTVICCIITIFLIVGFISFSVLYPEKEKSFVVVESLKIKKTVKKPTTIEHFEIYPEKEDINELLSPDGSIHKNGLPKVAIIIDDIGFDKPIGLKLMDLGIPITLSILPYSPHGDSLIYKARERGIELMLHLPMEPFEYPKVNPGFGAILTGMDRETIVDKLEKSLIDVPYIKGVNNHMGSKLTSDEAIMNIVMGVILEKKLFFIDSRTSKYTVCEKVAKEIKIPFAKRDIFLDHSNDEESIGKQVDQLIKVAEKKGRAIGIGHPYNFTYNVLQKRIPLMKLRVQFVKASELVN